MPHLPAWSSKAGGLTKRVAAGTADCRRPPSPAEPRTPSPRANLRGVRPFRCSTSAHGPCLAPRQSLGPKSHEALCWRTSLVWDWSHPWLPAY
eukprot:364044-Chlamydomonas_euryale.AAC.4